MKPLRLDLEMYADSAFDETVEVYVDGLPQPFDGWQFAALAATSVTATAKSFDLSVTVKENGLLSLQVDAAVLTALFEGSSATKRTFLWVLKAKPATDYYVRLFYGNITVSRGLPWP